LKAGRSISGHCDHMISAMFSLDKEGKYVEKSSVLNKWIDRMAVRGGWRTLLL